MNSLNKLFIYKKHHDIIPLGGKKMKKLFMIVGAIFILLIIGIIILSQKDNIQKVNGEEAREILQTYSDNAILIDVRTEEEYQTTGITGSILIPHDQIEMITANYPDKDTHIILYCNTGRRSNIAAKTLESLGYRHIYDMESYKNW